MSDTGRILLLEGVFYFQGVLTSGRRVSQANTTSDANASLGKGCVGNRRSLLALMSTILTPIQLVSNVAIPSLGGALAHSINRVCVLISSVIIVHYSRIIFEFSSISFISDIINQHKILPNRSIEEIIIHISATITISFIGNSQPLLSVECFSDILKISATILAIVWIAKISEACVSSRSNENNAIFYDRS